MLGRPNKQRAPGSDHHKPVGLRGSVVIGHLDQFNSLSIHDSQASLTAKRHASSLRTNLGAEGEDQEQLRFSLPARAGQAGEGASAFAIWGATTTLNLRRLAGPVR